MPKAKFITNNSYLEGVFGNEDTGVLYRAYVIPQSRRKAPTQQAAGQPKAKDDKVRIEGRTRAPSSLNLREGYQVITDISRQQNRRRVEAATSVMRSDSCRRLGTPLSYATGRPTYCEPERDAIGRTTGRSKEVPSVAGRNSPPIGLNWLRLPWCSIEDYPSAYHACIAMVAHGIPDTGVQQALMSLVGLNINSMYDLARSLMDHDADLGVTEEDLMFCRAPGDVANAETQRRTINEIIRFASYRGAVFVELQTKTPYMYTVVLVTGCHAGSGNIVYLDPQQQGTKVDCLQARLGDFDRRRAPGGSTVFVDLPESMRSGPGQIWPEPDRMQ
eukprot:gnl/MRDRNA2_/MRDRNA2_81888_c0_seq2.p1 gnl/MRDRNA2_/MRDRNA2_81888_c0~~gnl/MRDRNA2_/MRDRNA2_81888_c0_seq2.p1  ORF type:complete len:331 (-),score=42.33 gnl/MRDRNA2_/MRDRNA2_81888_c0_seq2:170-1162(-)